MNTKTALIPCISVILLFALALPASADGTTQVTVKPTDTITAAVTPAFDPVGAIEGIFGLRHDIRTLQTEDRNLTNDIGANRQEIHQNWWDNLNIFGSIFKNRETIRSDQAADFANRTDNIGYREDIHAGREDMRNDPGNRTADLQQIGSDRAGIQKDGQNIADNHGDIADERNATREDRAVIRKNRQQDLTLRQENNATHQEINTNREQIHADRQQIQKERENTSSAGAP